MTDTQRFDEVRDIIVDEFEIEKIKVMPDTSLRGDLGLYNIDRFALANRLKEELDFEVGGTWDDWQTVQDIVDTWKKQEASK